MFSMNRVELLKKIPHLQSFFKIVILWKRIRTMQQKTMNIWTIRKCIYEQKKFRQQVKKIKVISLDSTYKKTAGKEGLKLKCANISIMVQKYHSDKGHNVSRKKLIARLIRKIKANETIKKIEEVFFHHHQSHVGPTIKLPGY